MKSKSFAGMRCSIAGALEAIGDRWAILVLRDLAFGLSRYDELKASSGIPSTTLSSRLKHLEAHGLKVSTGTIVDTTIISAPSSTKNAAKARDPEMHQTKKGNQWYFGMKAHVGVDSKTKLIHSMETTAANVHDAKVLGAARRRDSGVWRSGLSGAERRDP